MAATYIRSYWAHEDDQLPEALRLCAWHWDENDQSYRGVAHERVLMTGPAGRWVGVNNRGHELLGPRNGRRYFARPSTAIYEATACRANIWERARAAGWSPAEIVADPRGAIRATAKAGF